MSIIIKITNLNVKHKTRQSLIISFNDSNRLLYVPTPCVLQAECHHIGSIGVYLLESHL